jgi:hypothetical protein
MKSTSFPMTIVFDDVICHFRFHGNGSSCSLLVKSLFSGMCSILIWLKFKIAIRNISQHLCIYHFLFLLFLSFLHTCSFSLPSVAPNYDLMDIPLDQSPLPSLTALSQCISYPLLSFSEPSQSRWFYFLVVFVFILGGYVSFSFPFSSIPIELYLFF